MNARLVTERRFGHCFLCGRDSWLTLHVAILASAHGGYVCFHCGGVNSIARIIREVTR